MAFSMAKPVAGFVDEVDVMLMLALSTFWIFCPYFCS